MANGAARFGAGPKTVGGTLVAAANLHGEAPALVFDGVRSNWRDLLAEVREMARRLVGAGVARGEHIGVLMPNCRDYVVLYYATQLVGARAVLLNSRYRPDDLAYVIPKADIDVLFVGGHAREHCDYRPMLEEALPGIAQALPLAGAPRLRSIYELGDTREGPWPQLAELDERAAGISPDEVDRRAAEVEPDDVGLMIFSSGTTSRPKACMLTHRSLTDSGEALAERFRLGPEDVVWDPLPLFHMSTILPLAACRAAGACFIGMSHFDADGAMDLLIRERPTVHYAGFPTIVGALVQHPRFPEYDQSRLRINHVVGPPDLLRRYAASFPGAVPVNSYGLTEATGVVCYSPLDDPPELLFETNGRVFDGTGVSIRDAGNRELPDGEPGEICLSGFQIFAGYYEDEDANRKAVDDAGRLHTGDLGRIGPGGRLVYEGRLKDMLKIGGENVAAVEIEGFLMRHPAIAMAQVVGVPDERLMEVAAAFIECAPGETVAEAEVIRHCLGQIASYKIPRYVRFVSDWPMSATKIQKFVLRRDFVPTGRIDLAAFRAAEDAG
ncbi:AMP-dependent synthetase [Novosphingobium marinum]|uniref:Acyl-CoA synthetase (AMP-forming)/AMP-acid ligase II n=1 Tax=Novosphingobium marinum TaxID=1514948 RepID=A0A7Y9XXZ2_9SPHN|nr:AMP-binding protein [Novosphingobium marinum]NYH95333.1 acyl-CoA synthetase (AMP-forming)/AMP-acid ligase II [Novosphingobium marinum]GGC26221.1 AMP-dependent synthetase [Novosphingobium marinum]